MKPENSPVEDFATRLLRWHARHGRHDLPWQNTQDAYRIWLSEIMLQQTQVDTVMPYYARFLSRFPDLPSLAAAPLDDVLALWSGLGYYARARNLHKAAQQVMQHHGGQFPQDAAALAELPGIGRSTAAAIAAFAYGRRGAILDGNVKRVLCRHHGIEGFPGEKAVENRLWALAESLLPDDSRDIGRYIQAQMDLGATLCTRSRPACSLCPVSDDCVALATQRCQLLPTPRPRKTQAQREVRLAILQSGQGWLLERRPPNGIWGGLLSLPELPDDAADDQTWLLQGFGVQASRTQTLGPVKHVFTHFRLTIHPVVFELDTLPLAVRENDMVWLTPDALNDAGLPAPVKRVLESLADQKGSPTMMTP